MKNFSISILLICCCSFFLPALAQKTVFQRYAKDFNMNRSQLQKDYSHEGFTLVLKSTRVDNEGNRHLKFQYQKEGNPIEGVGLTAHEDASGIIYLVNGTELSGSLTGASTEVVADDIAYRSIKEALHGHDFEIMHPETKEYVYYAWADLKLFSEWMYFSLALDGDLSKLARSMRVVVREKGASESTLIYLDASSGKILFMNGAHQHITINPPLYFDPFYGTQDVEVSYDGTEYTLYDDIRNITTHVTPAIIDPGTIGNSPDPNFSNLTGFERSVLDVHWGVGQAYDYFNNTFGYQSIDGQGAIPLVNYYRQNFDNALYNQFEDYFEFGDGQDAGPFDEPITSIDIVGHEYTHGVIRKTGDLFYTGESGAINESLADIFGLAIENYALGSYDWVIGELPTIGDVGMRSFSNPMVFQQPQCYGGPFFQDTENGDAFDNFGVHINSGILNHWFYLVVEGGQDTNCDCTGAGPDCTASLTTYDIAPAADYAPPTSPFVGNSFALMTDLLFQGLANGYVGLNTEFDDMREATDQIAHDLGYSCAFRENLIEAWYAVGVGPEPDCNCEIFAEANVLDAGGNCIGSPATFSAWPENNDEFVYNWTFSDGAFYPNAGSVVNHTFTQDGNQSATVQIVDATLLSHPVCSSLLTDPVTSTDQTGIGIFPDCNPDPADDCAPNAGPSMELCFGTTSFQLNAPDSDDYADPSNVTWSLFNPPSGVDPGDIQFSFPDGDFTPVVTYLGGLEFPEGIYVFQLCVDCETLDDRFAN